MRNEDLLESGENRLKEWEVKSNVNELNLMSICDEIEKGYNEEGGINLRPYYQRDYKFTRHEESLLIESLLAGIPVPTIYLASDTTKIPHISNVIDGHHRLKAVYRFLNDKFSLTGLKKYYFLNGQKFKDLNPTIQNKLKFQVSLTLQYIHMQNNPELEIEIFTRYNKGTNQLTSQEIRNVIFYSAFHRWLEKIIDEFKKDEVLSEVYNITSSRYKDKKIHQSFYVMFSIVEDGINEDFYASTEYRDDFMKKMKEIDNNEETSKKYIEKYKSFIKKLNIFLKEVFYNHDIINPFSKEVYHDVSVRNHKFQTSIMMIMMPVYDYLLNTIDVNFTKEVNANKIRDCIKEGFLESGFEDITSSTTHPDRINSVSNKILKLIKEITFA
ncbi:DUF262 domain-containing protein [Halocella sp. SP3-1]|uniref:DUF262 domain-containing protein n=1 Tax=Halocella sp. SP3-1 TaxID=2382161 RepID=UPI000F752DD4|nr:DUF262 domain-containing protein [Halocella sp. SP3-1]AZO94953.1 DUF262 domain-containing protein [Halocella sp. SP3-1]